MKVSIWPFFRGEDKGDGGIRRVVDAQHQYLPEFDIEPVQDLSQADIMAVHAGSLRDLPPDVPVVAHCHGLYWTAEEEWPLWAWELNQRVISVMRQADAVTAPTEWVAQSLRRGMLANPTVVPHGVDCDEWTPGENRGYVLWNKNRPDPVCDPVPVRELAERAGQVPFVTTFGEDRPNVTITGKIPYADMHKLVSNAGIYLATPRETFGIGTLEAMACGVPILGWNWGGQVDIVEHKMTGYLAEPGNYDDLLEGMWWCFGNRETIAPNAREAAKRFDWYSAIEMYANLYHRVYDEWGVTREAPRTSVIIPCYNHAQHLKNAVKSLIEQTDPDWEAVIVDDCSPDDTAEVGKRLSQQDDRVKYIRTPENLYLAGARNFGIANSRGRYIQPLDADDMLAPEALRTFADALDADRTIDIVYGGMEVLDEQGEKFLSQWPYEADFIWAKQMVHQNQLPYASMYRRRVWEDTGGYRLRVRTAEDADFWCRASSFGFRPHKVTTAGLLRKFDHKDSMGYTMAEPEWEKWFGWRHEIATTPFGNVGQSPESRPSWPVYSHESPQVSVIIPVGPGHEKLVTTALDSVIAQSYSQWEVIVIDDTREGLELPGFPFAHLIKIGERAQHGAAAARNAGLAIAKAPVILFLDADDYLQPSFLETCMVEFDRQCGEAVIYTDFIAQDAQGGGEGKELKDFDPFDVLEKGVYSITALYPRHALLEIGGHDLTLPTAGIGWEDWDLQIALTVRGYCGVRIPIPLFTYRYPTGQRREDALASKDELLPAIRAKYAEYHDRRASMAGCRGCGGRRSSVAVSSGTYNPAQAQATLPVVKDGQTLVEYMGNQPSKFRLRGKATQAGYIFAKDGFHERVYVFNADLAQILELAPPNGPMRVVEAIEQAPVNGAPDPIGAYEHALPNKEAPETIPTAESIPVPTDEPRPDADDVVSDPGGDGTQSDESRDTPPSPPGGSQSPSDMSVSQIRAILPVSGLTQLRHLRRTEAHNKNRKSALKAIDAAITAAEAEAAVPA